MSSSVGNKPALSEPREAGQRIRPERLDELAQLDRRKPDAAAVDGQWTGTRSFIDVGQRTDSHQPVPGSDEWWNQTLGAFTAFIELRSRRGRFGRTGKRPGHSDGRTRMKAVLIEVDVSEVGTAEGVAALRDRIILATIGCQASSPEPGSPAVPPAAVCH